MLFKDFIKYVANVDFILRIYSSTEMYELSFNSLQDCIDFGVIRKFGELPLKSVKVLKNKLIISLSWNYS